MAIEINRRYLNLIVHFLRLDVKLLQEIGVVATPGSGFGSAGEGYIRFSLTVATPRLAEAVERLKTLKL